MLVCLLLLPIFCGGLLQEKAEVNLNVTERVTVQQNLCVEVPCTFSYLGKDKVNNQIFFFWYLRGENNGTLVATNNPNSNISEKFRDRFSVIGTQSHDCTLSIKNAQKLDTGKYTLIMEEGEFKHKFENKVFINVSDLTQKPHIQVPETLKAGVQETLICMMPGACEGENSHTFLWIGSALSSQNPGNRTYASSKLSFIPKPRDHGTKITCQVTFKRSCVTSEKTIQLRVTYPPKKPTIQVHQGNWTVPRPLGNVSYLPVLEGESLSLSCTVESNPAVSLSWTKGKQTLTSSQLSVVSLQLQQVGPNNSGEYTCQTVDQQRPKKTSLMLSVQYPPKMLSSSCSWTEKGLLCTCSVQAHPVPSLRWWLGDSPVQDNGSNDALQVVSSTSEVCTNSSLSLRQRPDPTLNLRCEGKNRHGTHSVIILLVPDKTTPSTEMNKKTLILGAACGAVVTGLLALGLFIIMVISLRLCSSIKSFEALR
ncbi:sialic acid-binding Ig-like lectin 13 isoform X2 [Notamacropus eugenii]|uniref:sialic acid-binding Ig-like lectin 13 isoform X2 n=1 Tax=Notamacropus eugenii TaxID=9315 RepID=UPI003B685FA3